LELSADRQRAFAHAPQPVAGAPGRSGVPVVGDLDVKAGVLDVVDQCRKLGQTRYGLALVGIGDIAAEQRHGGTKLLQRSLVRTTYDVDRLRCLVSVAQAQGLGGDICLDPDHGESVSHRVMHLAGDSEPLLVGPVPQLGFASALPGGEPAFDLAPPHDPTVTPARSTRRTGTSSRLTFPSPVTAVASASGRSSPRTPRALTAPSLPTYDARPEGIPTTRGCPP